MRNSTRRTNSKRLLLAAAISVCAVIALPATASANVPFQTINGGAPVRNIFVGNELSCQVEMSVDAQYEFYPPSAKPGDCGTFVSVGSTVYGPDFAAHAGTATSGWSVVTPSSQSAVTGSGVSGDPFQVTTVAQAGPLQVTETTAYIKNTQLIGYRTVVTNTSGAPVSNIHVYRAADCYLQGSDRGYGAIDGSGGVYCTAAPDSLTDRLIGFIPVTPGSNYVEKPYSTVWDDIDGSNFPNLADSGVFEDNGAGLSWPIASLAAGASQTFDSQLKFFAPDPYNGTTGVQVNNQGEPFRVCGALTCITVNVTCHLPAGNPVPCDPFIGITGDLSVDPTHKKGRAGGTTTVTLAGGQAEVAGGESADVPVPTTVEGQTGIADQIALATKTAKKAKKLAKKAKKLKAKAKATHNKKLAKKAKKLAKKAKKLAKKAKQLMLVSGTMTVSNDRNGATDQIPVQIDLSAPPAG